MAAPKTVKTYDLNGTLKDFPITFEYLARKFVTVTLIGTDRQELVLNTDYRFSTPTQITTLRAAGWGPGDGYDLIEIRRLTSATDRLVDFADGSILRAFDLNTSQIQSLHIAEEARDLTADTIGVDDNGNLDARAKRIVNVADPVDPGDAVTLRYEQDHAASTLGNKLASEAARDIALGARDTTLTYRDAAGVHAGNANTQAGIATTQAGLSATAKTASEAARDAALGYRDQASTYATNSDTARAAAVVAKNAAESAASAASGSASTATSEADRAESYANSLDIPLITGNTLKLLRANAGETALEYVSPMGAIRETMVGTVSQSAGVPTGAILESGSGANGSWTKYADGTMICTQAVDASAMALTSAIGSLFQASAETTWTYPVAFTSAPRLSATAMRNDGSTIVGAFVRSVSTTATLWRLWSATSLAGGNAKDVHLTAIGRWF